MLDGLGFPQTALVLGGTSEIAVATLRLLVQRGCRRVVLGCRQPSEGSSARVQLLSAGAESVDVVAFDATDTVSRAKVFETAVDVLGDVDLVVLAFGVLGDQRAFEVDPDEAIGVMSVNFDAAVVCGLRAAQLFNAQGHGTLLVLSSVAGVRVRRDNLVYRASKAGLDAFAQGLGDSLTECGGRVVVVRPGFVATRMTAGLRAAPFATTPDVVAACVVRGLERGDDVIWAPRVLRWVFAILVRLPRRLWQRVSSR